jgi:hypothetical protein
MTIQKLVAGASVADPLASTGADVADSVNGLIDLNVASIKSLPLAADAKANTAYNVIGFYAGSIAGGGSFIWDTARSKAQHNGGTIIAPEAVAAWDGTHADVATYLNWAGSGNGCFVRQYRGDLLATWFGCEEGADSSASFNKAVEVAMLLSTPLNLESLSLSVNAVSAFTITSSLALTGNPAKRPLIDLNGSAEDFVFRIASAGIRLSNISFINGVDIVVAGDGSHPVAPNTLTGADIDSVVVENCSFTLCRRAVNIFSSKDGAKFISVKINNNYVDGGGVADKGYTGFSVDVAKMNYAEANDNEITRIDASQALDAGRPIQVACGRAIILGNNNPPADYTANSGWKVIGNKISSITDSRARNSGVNPEVGAIRVVSCYGAIVTGNTITTVLSSGSGVNDDCEGIYTKSVRGVVSNNVLTNAGLNGGAIVIKGYPEQGGIPPDELSNLSSYGYNGVCHGNTIDNSTVNNSSGIAIYSSGWIVSGNNIASCGGLSNRYAPIWTSASNLSNLVIADNVISASKGAYGILARLYGYNISVKNNTIDGVLCSATGLSNQHSYGIFILNDDSSGFNATDNTPLQGMSIEGNSVRNLVKMTGFDRIALAVSCRADRAATDALTIKGNKINSAADVGLRLLSGTFTHISVDSNDFRNATDVYSLSGSPTVTAISAYDNNGWLYGELAVDPPSVAAGASINIGNASSIQDVVSRDYINASCSGSLSGLILTASCSTNGQIDFFLFNPTGAAVDLGTRTFRAKAVKFAN